MRGFILTILAGSLLAGPALADGPNDRRNDDRRSDRYEQRYDRRDDRRDDRREWRQDSRNGFQDQRYWRQGRGSQWNWAGPRYRGQAWAPPRGVAFRPYRIGRPLNPVFVSQPYWIGNPGFYRLPPAFRGSRWVRYGRDALLIRIGDGVVVQVASGLWF